MPEDLVVILAEHVRNSGVAADGWIFPGKNGPVDDNLVDVRWRRTRSRAGIHEVTIHALRHYYASGLIASGCDVVTVQRALGHSSPNRR